MVLDGAMRVTSCSSVDPLEVVRAHEKGCLNRRARPSASSECVGSEDMGSEQA